MKKYIIALAFLLLPCSLAAQFTSVTATITEPSGQTWNNGKYSATLVNPQPQNPPTINGTKLTAAQMSVSGTMSSSGVITTSIADNSVVVPSGTYWQFTLCPNASSSCQVKNASTSGGSQDLSSSLSSGLVNISFPASSTAFGYADSEVSPIPNPGSIYYNVTSQIQRIWTGTTWVDNAGGGSPVTNPNICTANTVGAKCLGLSPYLAVSGDWTNAIIAAKTDLCNEGGGILYIQNKTTPYYANGPNLGNDSAVIPLCGIAEDYTTFIPIEFRGFNPVGGIAQASDAELCTTTNTGNFIGDYNAAGPFGGFTNTRLRLTRIRFCAPDNPNITMVHAQFMSALTMDDVWTEAGGATLGSAPAVWMPDIANDVENIARDYSSVGFETGIITGEHATLYDPHCGNVISCVGLRGGGLPGYPHEPNSVLIIHPWAQGTANLLAAKSIYPIPVTVLNADSETSQHVLYDPSNLVVGLIQWNVPYDAVPQFICNPNNVGGNSPGLIMQSLQCPKIAIQENTINFYNGVFATAADVTITHTPNSHRLDSNAILDIQSNSLNDVIDKGIINSLNGTNSYAQYYAAGSGDIAGGKYVRMIEFDSNASFGSPVYIALSGYVGSGPNSTNGLTLNTEAAASLNFATNSVRRQVINADGSITYWYSVAPTGACTNSGSWAFSQDGHVSYCNAGTWAVKI